MASVAPNTISFHARFFLQVERELKGGKINEQSLQAFAINNIVRFTELLSKGINKIQNNAQKLATSGISLKPGEFMSEPAILEAFTAVLSNPASASLLFKDYDVMVKLFLEKLVDTRENYMLALRNEDKKTKIDLEMFAHVTKTICVLRILQYSQDLTQSSRDKDRIAATPGKPCKFLFF